MTNIGHWEFPHTFLTEDWHGFVYRVIDLTTKQEYIGKKSFFSYTKKRIKGRKNKKHIVKESKWREYTTSSTHINKAIIEKGKENFKFCIISLHESKASLSYAETRLQVLEDVLRVTLNNSKIKKYYNKQIGAVRFIPPLETLNESKMKVSDTLIKHFLIESVK